MSKTKTKLLKAALELFAEFGYEATSTRDICSKAGVNNASIGYHFGDKRSLYLAVLQKEIGQAESLHQGPTEGTPEQRLASIIQISLKDVFSGREGPRGQLALREIVNPSEELLGLIKESMSTQFRDLLDCLKELAPNGAGEDKILLIALSIVGQIQYYRVFHRFIPHMIGKDKAKKFSSAVVAEHIIEFSITSLQNSEQS